MTTDPAQAIRDAATVVLLRDGDRGLETWLLRRVAGMTFAGGMTVFPGGRVDPGDADLPFVGADWAGLAARFDDDETSVRALVGAAARETFEETGVLVTVPPASVPAAVRSEVEAGRLAFGDVLRESDLAVDAEALHAWSRWVTPDGQIRRYDTRFFVCALPPAAEPQNVTTESSEAVWAPIGAAIEEAQRGERVLLPPTLLTLASLLPFTSVADALAAAPARRLETIRPTLRHDGDSVHVELPDGTTFPIPRRMLP